MSDRPQDTSQESPGEEPDLQREPCDDGGPDADTADDTADHRAEDRSDDGADHDTEPETERETDGDIDADADRDAPHDGDGDADQVPPEPDGTPAGEATGEPDASAPVARRRLTSSTAGASILIGVLFALLGFGLAVQVRTTSSTSGLSGARQEDLVRILDDLSSREDRLRQQIASLEAARRKLSTSGDKASVALSEAQNRSTTLGILAGTVPAQGPGLRLTISDPGHKLAAEDLLDAIEELRAAGGEAFQVGPVRIGLSSSFTDERGVVVADGTPLEPPYTILAIGDAGTLATALNIPGGVVASVRNAGGQATVAQEDRIVITALRSIKTPEYASPATKKGGD